MLFYETNGEKTMCTGLRVLSLVVLCVAVSFAAAGAEVRSTVSSDGVVVQTSPSTAPAQAETGGGGGSGVMCGGSMPGSPISVDGCPEDWFALGMRPVITDEYGDFKPEGDLLNVWVMDDGRDAFFLAEFAVPLDTLRKLATGALIKFSVLGMNDATPVGRYFLRGVGANVHGFLSVEGFCANFTTGQFINIPAGQGSWNCPDFGFRARPGDQVFTGAAGVVLAPPRPKK